ncbi:cleft lip and palate transmembrane 1 [Tothia fuscella]|uniref:Cleft lip and palate transmembrane 1 n=1 Tax=Tothia fuscella TaxID=1048955 RepID=A0A9P4NFT6_9PEZI|nr:cleft lip and palate transmembrane 1 [Tothia fuscella]
MPAAPAQSARPRDAPAAQGSGSAGILRSIVQSVAIFIFIQFVMKQVMPKSNTPAAVVTTNPDGTQNTVTPPISGPIPAFSDRPTSFSSEATYNPVPQNIAPMWPLDTLVDLSVYVSPSLVFPGLRAMPKDSLVINEKAFKYGGWDDKREIDTTFSVPKEVQNNGTLWAHFLVAQTGSGNDPTSSHFDPAKAYHFSRPLTQFLVKKKVAKRQNLLAGKNKTEPTAEEAIEAAKGPTWASYYHPNFTLSFVPDSGTINYPSAHPALRQFIQLERTSARDEHGQNGWYYPVLYVNTFWQLKTHMTELNDTVKTLPLHITLNNLANWKYSILATMDESMKETARNAAAGKTSGVGSDGSEFEQLKVILLDSNPFLLGTTFIVSILHMIFEMLAFKNDVSHWRKKKDNVGTSLRTILANVFMQTIIFLYLLDNNENTSWMILFGQGMGIAIEAWKITKTVNVRIRPTPQGSLLPYTIAFEDKHKLSDTEKKTQEYDAIAFTYMYYIAIPLLLAYATYSVIYDSHKSWYSFIITTLVGSVYAYGFLMMVPSLYINYRLKSVAHLPGKAMMYKFLNTFIDDLFAFTIKMPMLHRLATLRDDVIFFVYLYQSYKYKVDYSRVNEFGQGGGEDEEVEGTGTAEKPAIAGPEDNSGAKGKALAVEEGVKASGASVEGNAKQRR